jgi:hypothetical protein
MITGLGPKDSKGKFKKDNPFHDPIMIPEQINADFWQLILSMMAAVPKDRPSFKKIMG